jgi:hypothetical protein
LAWISDYITAEEKRGITDAKQRLFEDIERVELYLR